MIWGPDWNNMFDIEGKPMDNGFLRDEFGFKKLIFGLTNTHTTVTCISTKAGYVEWNLNLDKQLEEMKFLDKHTTIVYSHLFILEQDKGDDLVAVLFQNSRNESILIALNYRTGAI